MADLDQSRPFYKVEFYESSSGNPKYIFSPNIFLDTEKPDPAAVSAEVYITNISVDTKLDTAINSADIELRHGIGGKLDVELAYMVKIYFGFYDQDKTLGPEYSLAYTGYVTQIKNGLEKTTIYCKSSLKKITGKKVEVTFSKMMTVDELINQFAISTGGLDLAQNGIASTEIKKQPGFGITKELPILEHIRKLAKYCLMNVFMDVFDKFHMQPWEPSSLKTISSQDGFWAAARGKSESPNSDFYKHKLIYDQRLLDINFEVFANKYSGVEVVSYVPFSEEQVHTIEPDKIEFKPPGGDGDDKPLKRYKVSHVVREDAEKIAENLYWSDFKNIAGHLKLFGHPQIRVGDGVEFDGEGFEDMLFRNVKFSDGGAEKNISDILFQVAEVQHKFDTVEGYVTKVKLQLAHTAAGAATTATGAGAAGTGAGVGEGEGAEFGGGAAGEETAEGLVTVKGYLRDPDGNILSNLDYRLECPNGEILTGVSDDKGEVYYDSMPKGRYIIYYPKNLIKNEKGEWVPVEGDDEEDSIDFEV